MTFKHYDVVRGGVAVRPCGATDTKLKEGWQPFGSPVAITPYTLRCRPLRRKVMSPHLWW
ncbi:DUF1737 domain-containing protein [Escherichia coli]|nr:DUF1737 domain-containing protein [Escherichia coli]